jgi:hypothetical protein
MVTNFLHPVASEDSMRPATDEPPTDGIGGRVVDRLRQVLCGLHGHDNLLQFEQDRMFLRCVSCGHESPGWSLNEVPPTVTAHADARQPAFRPQLVGARRIA